MTTYANRFDPIRESRKSQESITRSRSHPSEADGPGRERPAPQFSAARLRNMVRQRRQRLGDLRDHARAEIRIEDEGIPMHQRGMLALVASLAMTALPVLAFAQGTYPERPIKLMVAFSAGGVNDVVARHWAERMRPLLGTVYVENQGGGTGTIGTAEVARA